MTRPSFRLVLGHLVALAILAGAYSTGVLDGLFAAIGSSFQEICLSLSLIVFGLIGVAYSVFTTDRPKARFFAHGGPILGLCFTGLGMFHAFSSLTSISDTSQIINFMHLLIYAMAPNVIGVAFLFWIWIVLQYGHNEVV